MKRTAKFNLPLRGNSGIAAHFVHCLTMKPSLQEIIESYNPHAPLAEAWTIPARWYVDTRIMELESRTVFARSWQVAGRAD
ncbi:MAG TPA: hypothetical protein VGO69_01720, partial [Pyrinomonadaceae bacterium]|nr:hypothetical protein [Pyrinomonadaceae bacterium]